MEYVRFYRGGGKEIGKLLILELLLSTAGMWDEINHTECTAEKEMESSVEL